MVEMERSGPKGLERWTLERGKEGFTEITVSPSGRKKRVDYPYRVMSDTAMETFVEDKTQKMISHGWRIPLSPDDARSVTVSTGVATEGYKPALVKKVVSSFDGKLNKETGPDLVHQRPYQIELEDILINVYQSGDRIIFASECYGKDIDLLASFLLCLGFRTEVTEESGEIEVVTRNRIIKKANNGDLGEDIPKHLEKFCGYMPPIDMAKAMAASKRKTLFTVTM